MGITALASAVIVLAWLTQKKARSQKIDNLSILATCRSGTAAMLSSKVRSRCSWKHSVVPDTPLTNLT